MPGSFSVPATGSGPLTGSTLAVKDMFALEGHVSSFGHPRWRETHGPSTTTAPVLDVLAAGPDAADISRVVLAADCLAEVSPAASDAVRNVAADIAHYAGCDLAEEDLGAFFSGDVADLFARNQAREIWAAHGAWLAANTEVLAPDVTQRVKRAEVLSASPPADRLDDERAWHAYTAALDERLPADTIAVIPVLAGLPLRRDASAAEVLAFRTSALTYTAPGSLTGRPELVIPVRHAATGLHVGVGLLGPRGSDAALVRIASRILPPDVVLAV